MNPGSPLKSIVSRTRPALLAAAFAACAPAAAQEVAHAKLAGRVGFRSGQFTQPAFDAASVKEVLDKALAQKCAAVVLEVESGGGAVLVGLEVAKLLRERQAGGARIVAWYGEAGSAASWIPFACADSVTKPGGLCGGSVMYSIDASGKHNPVEAKFASFSIAEVKNAARAAGRPELLVDAIFEQPREVWLTSKGTLVDRKPAGDESAKCIDSAAGVLNMDAATAIELGFAKGPAADRDAAAKAVGLAPTRWVDLSGVVTGRNSRLAAKDESTRKAVHAWFTAVDEMMAKVEDAIEATHDTAATYESEQVPDGDTKVAGSRARKALGEHMGKVRSAAAAIKFDGAIAPEGELEAKFRSGHGAMQQAILDRVSEIRDRLAERSTKKALEAAREAKRLFAELQEFTKTLQRPY